MAGVRFSLPPGYSLATRGLTFAFTIDGEVHHADAEGRTYRTPGAAVRAVISHAGLTGSPAAAVLLRQVDLLPEASR